MPYLRMGIGAYMGKGSGLGALNPLIWTKVNSGVTIGTEATLSPLSAAWSIQGLVKEDLGGGVYKHTVDTTNTLHRTYRVPTNAFSTNMPAAFTVYAKKDTDSQCNRIRINNTGSQISLNLDTGLADRAVEIESSTVTNLGSGWWKLDVKALQGAMGGSAWILNVYDPTNTLLTWDATGVDARILLKDVTYSQKSIATWADPRNPSIYWEQATVAAQPHLWEDSRGPCIFFKGAHYMTANGLASLFQGDDKPISFAVAADNVLAGALGTVVISLARTTVGDFHVLRWPNATTNALLPGRRDSDLVIVNLPVIAMPHEPQGAAIDVYDGTNRYLLACDRAEVMSAITSGATVFNTFSIGALIGGTVTNHWLGRVREIAATPGIWSQSQRAHAHNYLTSRYGY